MISGMAEVDPVDAVISMHVSTLPWTVATTARQLGMSRSSLDDRLHGRARWLARELPAVARLCETTVSELVGADFEAEIEVAR